MRRKRRFGLRSIWRIGLLIAFVVAGFVAAKSFLRRQGQPDEVPEPAVAPIRDDEAVEIPLSMVVDESAAVAAVGSTVRLGPISDGESRAPAGGVRRRAVAVAATLVVAMVALAGVAIASHGGPIDLTTAGASGDHDGGYLVQGGIAAGTGNFDPFLSINPQGNQTIEQGFNLCTYPGCPAGEFDTFTGGGGRTHDLLISSIPVVVDPPGVPNGSYREFSLDANDSGSDDYMSIDELIVFFDDQDDLWGYDPVTRDFSGDTGSIATLEWGILDSDQPVLMRSQTLTPGSGVSDITLLLPDSMFPTDCYYGSTSCSTYFIMWMEAGGYVDDSGHDWDVTAGFEEWRTRLQPVVNVSKTADTSLTRTYDWTVAKKVSTDGSTWVDADSVDLFTGDVKDIDWQVTAARLAGVDSGWAVSGTITITNPTGDEYAISKAIPATINSVEDVITPGDITATVDCGVTFPYDLGAGDTLVCTYSKTVTDASATTNTAKVNIDIDDTGGTLDYTGTAAIDFSAATVTEFDESATISDNKSGPGDLPGGSFTAGATWEYDDSVTCDADSGEYKNTAVLVLGDSLDERTDDAKVDVTCQGLSVSKTADTSLTRTYDWTVAKKVSTDGSTWVDADSVDLFTGDVKDIDWQVTAARLAGVDSGWAVSGTITITNASPNVATGVAVSDSLPGAIGLVIDCGGGPGDTVVDVPAKVGDVNGMATCSYSAGMPDGSTQTNTAKATLFGEDYTGTQSVDFSAATVTEVDESATISDNKSGPGDLPGGSFTAGATWEYDDSVTCDADSGEYKNTAVLVEGDSLDERTDDAKVDVTCQGLSVSKTADTSLTRTYDWTVAKKVSTDGSTWVDADSVDLFTGDVKDIDWQVTAARLAGVDSGWAVSGTITITNASPNVATGVAVSDSLPGAIGLVIDCGGGPGDTVVDVPAKVGDVNGMATCSYSAGMPDGSTQTNTAKATLFGEDYTGTQSVDFSAATVTEVDESATISDNKSGPGDLPGGSFTAGATWEYDDSVTCDADSGEYKNTAVLVEGDSLDERTDDAKVDVTCQGLSVSKTADTSLTRTYDWTVAKKVSTDGSTWVDADSVDLFTGDVKDIDWQVTAARLAGVDSGWAVSGTITITNASPNVATGVAVSDSLPGAIGLVIDCGGGPGDTVVDVPAKVGDVNGMATCSYSAGMPDGSTQTNTAKATLFGEDYTGTQSVDFSAATVTEVDESATISDNKSGPGDLPGGSFTAGATWEYDDSVTCDADSGEYKNTAVLVEGDSLDERTDDAKVDVTCQGLSVSKTADTTFTRTYNWTIEKEAFLADGSVVPSTGLVLQEGQSYNLEWRIRVDLDDPAYIDSGWAVSGTITITNASPNVATGVAVSDSLPGAIGLVIDCGDGLGDTVVDVPAKVGDVNGMATCSYSAGMPDGSTQTNTAKATLFGEDYTGTQSVVFATPTTEVNETVLVTDLLEGADFPLPGEPVTIHHSAAPETITVFTLLSTDPTDNPDVLLTCDPKEITNRADIWAYDDSTKGTNLGWAERTVPVTVECFQGCTLTQGYWKTHNDSFWGGAPTDETWSELLFYDYYNTMWKLGNQDSPFFKSGQSFFEVMWTAPKGNVYYNLGRQYIAAQLNFLNDADSSAVATEFAAATDLFMKYSPEDTAKLKGKNGKELRKEFIDLASVLAKYNEGDIGPGHCDEDLSSDNS